MKYLNLTLFSIFLLTACAGSQPAGGPEDLSKNTQKAFQANILEVSEDSDLEAEYNKADKLLADFSRQIHQPNILKDDILRGWYMGSESERKYGTPNTWVFIENGVHSKWMSPNALDEEALIDGRQLCRQTAGFYRTSCLDSSETDCEYIEESYCECSVGTKWKEDQGCLVVTEKGSFVSVSKSELSQGFYPGFPNQKKLNTPADWIWVEEGRKSKWQSE